MFNTKYIPLKIAYEYILSMQCRSLSPDESSTGILSPYRPNSFRIRPKSQSNINARCSVRKGKGTKFVCRKSVELVIPNRPNQQNTFNSLCTKMCRNWSTWNMR